MGGGAGQTIRHAELCQARRGRRTESRGASLRFKVIYHKALTLSAVVCLCVSSRTFTADGLLPLKQAIGNDE